jgi:uncharacterized membrane protein YbhN (UPF0104 family)
MSEAAVSAGPLAPEHPSKRRRVAKIVSWIVGLVVLLALLHLAGVDVWGWLSELWDTVTEISFFYIVLGCLFQAASRTWRCSRRTRPASRSTTSSRRTSGRS